MDSLNVFIQESPLEIRVFDILYSSYVGEKGVTECMCGFDNFRTEKYKIIDLLNGNIIKPVEHYLLVDHSTCPTSQKLIHKQNLLSEEELVNLWTELCEVKLEEGMVIKTNISNPIDKSGKLLPNTLKVRGRNYLPITHGMYLYSPAYFNRMKGKRRSTTMKKLLHVRENELGYNIIKSIIRLDLEVKNRYVGGFLGLESGSIDAIDKLL